MPYTTHLKRFVSGHHRSNYWFFIRSEWNMPCGESFFYQNVILILPESVEVLCTIWFMQPLYSTFIKCKNTKLHAFYKWKFMSKFTNGMKCQVCREFNIASLVNRKGGREGYMTWQVLSVAYPATYQLNTSIYRLCLHE